MTSSKSQRSEESRERVALGRDVEVKLQPKNGYHPPRQNGLQQRAPSLDDIMGKIKGDWYMSSIQVIAVSVTFILLWECM